VERKLETKQQNKNLHWKYKINDIAHKPGTLQDERKKDKFP
jgi:hypothetical protein